MLREYKRVSQGREGFRRLFFDDWFDLYVWYDSPGGEPSGFQLVYDKVENPHTLTWVEDKGYIHNRVDEGERSGELKMSPILVPDGVFDKQGVLELFGETASNLEPALKAFVTDRIAGYTGLSERLP